MNKEEISTIRRYIISWVRLFISTFLSTLALQITSFPGDVTIKTLASFFLSILVVTVHVMIKWAHENDLIGKIIDYFVNKLIK